MERMDTPQRFAVSLDFDTLNVRDNVTSCEYTRTIDDALCNKSYNIFRFPVALRIIEKCIKANSGFAISLQHATNELIVIFSASFGRTIGIGVRTENLEVRCAVRHQYATSAAMTEATARLEDTIAQLSKTVARQDEIMGEMAREMAREMTRDMLCARKDMVNTMAVLAQSMQIQAVIDAKERIFGRIPEIYMNFARKVIASADTDGFGMFKCLAVYVQSAFRQKSARYFLDISSRICVDYTRALDEERDSLGCFGGNTCFLWIPSVVTHIDCFSKKWSRIIPLIPTSRLIIGEIVIAVLLRYREKLRVHPSVRSVVIKSASNPEQTWNLLQDVLHKCELIVPEAMRGTCPVPLTGSGITFIAHIPACPRTMLYDFKRISIVDELKVEDPRTDVIALQLPQ